MDFYLQNGSAATWAYVVASAGMVLFVGWWCRWRSVYVAIVAFYFYFAFGPVIAYLFGLPIYFGIMTEHIEGAAQLMFLATIGWSAAAIMFAPRDRTLEVTDPLSGRRWEAVPIVLLGVIGLTSIGILILLSAGSGVLSLPKSTRGNIVTPELHSAIMLLQWYTSCLYFLVRTAPLTRKLYYASVALWVVYCLLASERDFFYAIGSVILVAVIMTGRRIGFQEVAVGAAGLAAATIVKLRGTGEAGIIASILKQGSQLFVDTIVLDTVPAKVNYFFGFTYWNAAKRLVPRFVWASDFSPLYWLKTQYSPGGNSGYGFSLEAEAYMNFGRIGVPIFFALYGASLIYLLRRVGSSAFWTYASVFVTGQSMYAIRNDFTFLLKGFIYAMVFFLVIMVLSSKKPIVKSQFARQEESNGRRAVQSRTRYGESPVGISGKFP